MQRRLVSNLLGVLGGIIGGVVGYFAFVWLYHQGFYGLMLPGAMLGFGCGVLARHRSIVRGIACGLAAAGLGLYTEWKWVHIIADDSFSYMVRHFHEKPPVTLVMLLGGILLAFWLGKDGGFSSRPDIGQGARPSGDANPGPPSGGS